MACNLCCYVVYCSSEDYEKDIEMLLIRQQLRIATRNQERGPNNSHWEKLTLAILVHRLKQISNAGRMRLACSVLLFKPDTLPKWHGEMVVESGLTSEKEGLVDPE